MSERYFAQGGSAWSSIANVNGFDGVHLRQEQRGGRLVVTGVYVHAPEITTRLWRTLELQRLAALMVYVRALDGDPSDPRKRADRELTIEQLESHIDKATTFDNSNGKPEPLDQLLPQLMKLMANDKSAFYEAVSDLYLEQASLTASPVKDIAEGLGVPASRVARWVREARIAGALPSARPGVRG